MWHWQNVAFPSGGYFGTFPIEFLQLTGKKHTRERIEAILNGIVSDHWP